MYPSIPDLPKINPENQVYSLFNGIFKASKFKNWTLDGRKLVVDLCGSKSATFEERTNMESTTLSVQGNTEFDEDDLRQTFEDAVAIRIG